MGLYLLVKFMVLQLLYFTNLRQYVNSTKGWYHCCELFATPFYQDISNIVVHSKYSQGTWSIAHIPYPNLGSNQVWWWFLKPCTTWGLDSGPSNCNAGYCVVSQQIFTCASFTSSFYIYHNCIQSTSIYWPVFLYLPL